MGIGGLLGVEPRHCILSVPCTLQLAVYPKRSACREVGLNTTANAVNPTIAMDDGHFLLKIGLWNEDSDINF
ncbi:hypothetical protein KC337_g32 [Hortaea werneckii]|nr:hypothetical protein KC337_g32 [Hortaea werneckii]